MIGPNPPAESPYRVEYPVAISLLLPVVSTRCPSLLDTAMLITPRTRDCRFSAGSPDTGKSPSPSLKASTTGWMAMVRALIPCRSTRSSASLTEWPDDHLLGIRITCTFSGPTASAAIVATSAESIPPDSASSTDLNPFLRT